MPNLTTDWGDVMTSMIDKLSELVDEDIIVQVQAGTEKDFTAWAPKGFPSLFLEWKGSTVEKQVTLLSNGFCILERGHWELHHYCSSGRTDAAGMFQKDGPFTISRKSREKLLGMMPEGQINNAYQLRKEGDGEIETFTSRGGSGGMLYTVPYFLDQMIGAVGA